MGTKFKFKENAKFYLLSKPDRALQNRTHGKPRRKMYSFCLIFWTLLGYLISRLRRDKSNQNVLEWREMFSLRKQPTFSDATTGFPAKWRLRNERRNSILMTRHYPDLGSASDWSCRVGNLLQPIRSTTQIWVVTRHQYGISALVSQTSFRGETSGGVAECRLFLRLREGVLNFCTHKFHAFCGPLLFFQIIFEFLVRHF